MTAMLLRPFRTCSLPLLKHRQASSPPTHPCTGREAPILFLRSASRKAPGMILPAPPVTDAGRVRAAGTGTMGAAAQRARAVAGLQKTTSLR